MTRRVLHHEPSERLPDSSHGDSMNVATARYLYPSHEEEKAKARGNAIQDALITANDHPDRESDFVMWCAHHRCLHYPSEACFWGNIHVIHPEVIEDLMSSSIQMNYNLTHNDHGSLFQRNQLDELLAQQGGRSVRTAHSDKMSESLAVHEDDLDISFESDYVADGKSDSHTNVSGDSDNEDEEVYPVVGASFRDQFTDEHLVFVSDFEDEEKYFLADTCASCHMVADENDLINVKEMNKAKPVTGIGGNMQLTRRG